MRQQKACTLGLRLGRNTTLKLIADISKTVPTAADHCCFYAYQLTLYSCQPTPNFSQLGVSYTGLI